MAHEPGAEALTLRGALRVLRRRAWVVVLCVLLVPGAALAFSLSQEERYTATAELLFRDPGFDQTLFGSELLPSNTDPEREAATNASLVSLDKVVARTATDLGVSESLVEREVETEPEGQANIIEVHATDEDPRFAASLANSFANEFIAFRQRADRQKIREAQQLVEKQLERLPEDSAGGNERALRARADDLSVLASLQTGNAELVQPASPPASPSSPQPIRNVALAGALGLALGVALAFLLERLDRRLRDSREVEETFDRPVIGAIRHSRALNRPSHQVVPPAEDADAFRMIRANLRYFNVDEALQSVLVTSAAPKEGKSTVAWNLAAVAASGGTNVVLLEADLRHPSLADRIERPPDHGLSDYLAGVADLEHVIHSVPAEDRANGHGAGRSLDVIFAGRIPPNPGELIESERMRSLIRRLEADYQMLVIDTPPTSVVSDAIPLVKQVNAVLVVSRLGTSTRESTVQLREQLRNLHAPVLGVVINAMQRSASDAYGYRYGYGS